jgi:hypothetical protein
MLGRLLSVWPALLLVCFSAAISRGQSGDQSLPTPVLTNEIGGTIRALDIGDSRQTRHFYAFEAEPGDLAITVNSRNLNGDVDVFTAVTFRPLLKISIYANTIPPEVSKGVYLRTHQILILRVEARSPDDDPGSYRITFGGSFQPFRGGIPVAENIESPETTTSRNGRRLSSVGATLPQPAEPNPEAARTEERPPDTEAAKETETKPEPKPKPARTTTRGSARNRTPRPPRPKPADTEKPKPESAKTETPETEKTKSETPKNERPKTARSKTTKPKVEPKPVAREEKSGESEAAAAPQELPGPHLIIEQKDGTRIDRPMSTVRRVVVEGGTIVVFLKTGKIERVPMSGVSRMSIEP